MSCCQAGPTRLSWPLDWSDPKELTKVYLVAIAVYAAVMNPLYFTAAFFAGFVMGLTIPGSVIPTVLDKVKFCSSGTLAKITGIDFHPQLAFAIDVSIFAVHLLHHKNFFPALSGFSLGAWAWYVYCSSCDTVKPG